MFGTLFPGLFPADAPEITRTEAYQIRQQSDRCSTLLAPATTSSPSLRVVHTEVPPPYDVDDGGDDDEEWAGD